MNRRSAQNEQDTGNTENTETSTEREAQSADALSPSKIVEFPGEDTDISPEVYRGLGMPGLAAKAEKEQKAQHGKIKRNELYTHPLWQAFRNAWPEDVRPLVAPRDAERYLEIIEVLVEGHVTPERVAALARKRLDAGKTGYSFLFVPNDIHEIPLSGKVEPPAKKPKGIWSQSAPDTRRTSSLTPEERAALVESGDDVLKRARREAYEESQRKVS